MLNRRSAIARLTAFFGAWSFGAPAAAAPATPAATEGPFYPTGTMRMADVDNDLVKVVGLVRQAGGEVIILKGRVLDENDRPRPGLRVEIWQCDLNGVYLHSRAPDRDSYDTGFQGFGHDITGEDGSYRFRTIMPTVYPGRTPHIHVKVLDGDAELLTTQFYLRNHPENARDRIYGRMSDMAREQVTMDFTGGTDGPETTVDIIV